MPYIISSVNTIWGCNLSRVHRPDNSYDEIATALRKTYYYKVISFPLVDCQKSFISGVSVMVAHLVVCKKEYGSIPRRRAK